MRYGEHFSRPADHSWQASRLAAGRMALRNNVCLGVINLWYWRRQLQPGGDHPGSARRRGALAAAARLRPCRTYARRRPRTRQLRRAPAHALLHARRACALPGGWTNSHT